MDELSTWINAWIEFSALARNQLEKIHQCEIEPLDFQEAVRESLGLKKSIDLVYKELPEVSSIVDALADYKFAALNPEVLEEIVIEGQFIPEEFPRLLSEQTIKAVGERWRIHKNDADPFPSSPHAHSLDTGLKLHLGSGELYRKTTLVGSIRCKDLRKLRSRVNSSIDLPPVTCD